ncbi:MAG: hypothetical protein ACI9DM_000251 [Cyclobacteriaceae bacterium]|jgi:hypothetical protein
MAEPAVRIEIPEHMQFMIDEGMAVDPNASPDPAPAPVPDPEPAPIAPQLVADPPPAPVADPPPAPAPADTDFDQKYSARVQESLSKRFGADFGSLDVLEGKYKQNTERLTELEKQNKILGAKASASIEWADESIAEYNTFAKETGIKSYPVFSRIKGITKETVEAKPLDALITQKIIENPDFASDIDYLKRRILKDYGFASTEEFEANENPDITMDIQFDAKNAFKKIEEYQAKIKSPEAVDYEKQIQEKEQLISESKEQLRGVVDKMTGSLQRYVFQPTEGEPYEFTFDDKTVAEMKSAIIEAQAVEKDPYDQKAYQSNINNVYGMAVAKNIGKIMSSHAKSVREMTEEQYRKSYGNPSAAVPIVGDPRHTSGVDVSASDQVMAWEQSRNQD